MIDQVERMRAILDQASAEAARRGHHVRLTRIQLVLYGEVSQEQAQTWLAQASAGTPTNGVAVEFEWAGSRFICWNCCGLRFEAEDGMCPNCGEVALAVPEEIAFALKKIETADRG